ncbi:MAG: NAD(P)-binding domain-containing protein [Pseudomonadota bacterium]
MRHIDEAAVAGRIDWPAVMDAVEAGHRLPKAVVGDTLLRRGEDRLLSRSAWIDGLGVGVKSMTIAPGNAARGAPSVQGVMALFEDDTAAPIATIDGPLVTYWKTAGDSALGARLLARPDSERLLVIGAGVVAASVVRAYAAALPALEEVFVWNRTPERAERFAAAMRSEGHPVRVAGDRAAAVAAADVIVGATMSKDPVIEGAWVKPGAHVDLIGAYTPDMREADDALMRAASVFVDSRDTTIGHIGDLIAPMASGALREADVLGDFYDLVRPDARRRRSADEITLFKNGGGAHLDVMTAHALLAAAASH